MSTIKKECVKCNKTKMVTQFHKRKRSLDGHQAYCKNCARKNANNQTERTTMDEYIVYLLPNFNKNGFEIYCGVTNNVQNRMKQHRFTGNNTEGHYEIARFATRREALLYESSQQSSMGYAGDPKVTKAINSLKTK